MRRGDKLTDRRLSDQSVALIVKRRAQAAGVEERKSANVTRHCNLPVVRGYIGAPRR